MLAWGVLVTTTVLHVVHPYVVGFGVYWLGMYLSQVVHSSHGVYLSHLHNITRMVFTSPFTPPCQFKNMPRQMFGKVQSKLFPMYFALHAGSIVVCAGCLAFGAGAAGGMATIAKTAAVSLGTALGASLLNLLILEPKATTVMFERYALENAPSRDEAKIKQLMKEFGKFHGISSLVNLVSMVAGASYTWWLASALLL